MSIWHGNVKHVFLNVASKKIKAEDFLGEWRRLVDELVNCRKRLKNPVNLKNGKPLAADEKGIVRTETEAGEIVVLTP